jgi:hypothetical protein
MLDGNVGFEEGVIHGGNTSWTDYSTETATRLLSYTTEFTVGDACVVFRYRDPSNLYWFGLGSFERKVAIGRKLNGEDTELAGNGSNTELEFGRTYVLKVEVAGSNIKAYLDDVLVLETTDNSHPNGTIGLRIWGSHCEFDYLRADPLEPTLATLTISASAGGSTSPAVGIYQYDVGSVVQVTANPSGGYNFVRWLLDGIERIENPISVTMDTDHSLQAEFGLNTIMLTVVAGAGGSVSPSGPQTLVVGQTYQFTAIEEYSKYKLDHWDLNGVSLGSTNPLPLLATVDLYGTLTALFKLQIITLNVVAELNGSVDPSGTVELNAGNSYLFTAIPDAGFLLDHWVLAGQNKGSTNPLPIIAIASFDGQTLTAYFSMAPPPRISVNVVVTGAGITDIAPGKHQFNVGETIVINATPTGAAEFIQWTVDGAIYTENPLNLPVTENLDGATITAMFTSPGPTPSILSLVPVVLGAILIRIGSG